MKRLNRLWIGAALAVSGCATGSGFFATTPVENTAALDRAVNQAFERLDELEARTPGNRLPASQPSAPLKARFSKLRGRTEILVFPKVSNRAAMNAEPVVQVFGSPIRFAATAQRLLNCRKLLQENSSQWNHREAFSADLHPELDCGIFEIRQIAPQIQAGNRKAGDLLSARTYLDSNYRAHGLDIEIYRARRKADTTHLKWDELEPLSSGLTLFPIDIPHADMTVTETAALPIPSDPYVRSKLKKFRASSCSRAKQYRYRDLYGNANTVAWCDGDAWPTVIDNPRFFAVTVKR